MSYTKRPFSSLVQFMTKEQNGTACLDATYRAYDLDKKTGRKTYTAAMRKLGYKTIMELRDDLALLELPGDDLTAVVCRWYVWYRLIHSEIFRWPYRKVMLPVPTDTTDQSLQYQ